MSGRPVQAFLPGCCAGERETRGAGWLPARRRAVDEADRRGHSMACGTVGELVDYAWCLRCGAGLTIDMATGMLAGGALKPCPGGALDVSFKEEVPDAD